MASRNIVIKTIYVVAVVFGLLVLDLILPVYVILVRGSVDFFWNNLIQN